MMSQHSSNGRRGSSSYGNDSYGYNSVGARYASGPLEGELLRDEYSPSGGNGRRKKAQLPAVLQKSRRMRRILIVIIVLLFAFMAALVYFAHVWGEQSKEIAGVSVQTQLESQEVGALMTDESATTDAASTSTKKTDVPDLFSVIGMTQEEALEYIGRGATVTKTETVETSSDGESDEVNSIKTNLTVSLTEEPTDSTSGIPTVYLGLDAEGIVVQVGYSAATTLLGYGSVSFADAISADGVIENSFMEFGIEVSSDSIVLPDDKGEYTTYASDGTTISEEKYSFSDSVEIDGVVYEWSTVLLYDYSMKNLTSSLSDTIRLIYLYVSV